MATLLTRYTAQARAVLSEHITAYDPISRERVAMLNGKLVAGPRPGGGYRVHAMIPLEEL